MPTFTLTDTDHRALLQALATTARTYRAYAQDLRGHAVYLRTAALFDRQADDAERLARQLQAPGGEAASWQAAPGQPEPVLHALASMALLKGAATWDRETGGACSCTGFALHGVCAHVDRAEALARATGSVRASWRDTGSPASGGEAAPGEAGSPAPGQLHADAPPVPPGLQARPGVEYGCGEAACTDCYEPVPPGDR